jgi:hypothetical protein
MHHRVGEQLVDGAVRQGMRLFKIDAVEGDRIHLRGGDVLHVGNAEEGQRFLDALRLRVEDPGLELDAYLEGDRRRR